jgi:hypothetical protein
MLIIVVPAEMFVREGSLVLMGNVEILVPIIINVQEVPVFLRLVVVRCVQRMK